MTNPGQFRFSIDRGGTFTDIYAEVPGEPGFRVLKLLSEDPANYEDAPVEGIRRIICEVTGREIPKGQLRSGNIEWIRMGTTVATNALLERKGARSALVITKGFGDILQIGNQDRPDIFDLEIRKPDMLYETVVEVDERVRILRADEHVDGGNVVVGTTGEPLVVLKQPDENVVRQQLENVYATGIRSLAIVLMHAYTYAGHEQMIRAIAAEIGFTQISLSSQVMPRVKLVARGDTTMVDAYLNPHIRSYLDGFKCGFADSLLHTRLLFMQSDGGLIRADGFSGSRAILSGPAGGVVGYAMTTRFDVDTDGSLSNPMIGFDMGGTSTDVSRFDGDYELVFETETAGVRIQAPQLHIKTVAAGGGSCLLFENGMFQVGPESAGAHPGPVCYRKNGRIALTDANLVLGRIHPGHFPCIFGPNKDQPLDVAAARAALEDLRRQINRHYAQKGRPALSLEQVALGFVQVANETMVRPIREISVMRGFDIKAHTLATFGGAGPQHACAVARLLGISRVFIHRFAGLLSAYGMGLADVVVERQQSACAVYDPESLQSVQTMIQTLKAGAFTELRENGFADADITVTEYLNLRYRGTDTALMIARPPDHDFANAFRQAYIREFGFDLTGRDLLIDDIRVRASGKSQGVAKTAISSADGPAPRLAMGSCYFENGFQETTVYDLQDLKAGHLIAGPALILQDTTTILVEPDCQAFITRYGDIEITVGKPQLSGLTTAVDPIRLSIFSNLFISIAEQMGRMLQKTAISTNIKERLDFSCALFGPEGHLVANAPHLPVHLGAMSAAVQEQIRRQRDHLNPGDVLVSNHPAAGGSHLPDITVITPVFRGRNIIFWVASRGHHGDIGGISPGSMPPGSRRIEEEGALITSFKLVENGVFQEAGIVNLLTLPGRLEDQVGRPPISGSRCLADNLSDLKAQVAANRKGTDLLLEMVNTYGLDVVQAYMRHVQNAAEDAVRDRLRGFAQSLAADTVKAVDYLDDGSPIMLTLSINQQDGSAHFDFSGTGHQIWGNLNAPKAVTRSAVLYCLRCLIRKNLPLNHGCLLPLKLTIPSGCLLDPSPDAAVVGGNVLTSQRVVDVVLKAFGVAAASQGCMNNFTFGNDRFGYYETIGGGAGAGPHWHGRSGVHTHMTNTRITDPEILERRYPVMLRQFSIRYHSGGQGRYTGGDGLIREVEFLEPLDAAILSERRVFAPYGLAGGKPGTRGQNLLITRDGRTLNLGGKNEIRAEAGSRVVIMTPGGGGFGPLF